MLSEAGITAALSKGEVEVVPFSELQLRGASYVLRLGSRFRRWSHDGNPVEMWSSSEKDHSLDAPFDTQKLTLQPGEFILGTTLERVGVSPALAASISPLSHVARFGLSTTLGADLVNPGYGHGGPMSLTLELFNHNHRALILTAGMPIAHLRLFQLTGGGLVRDRRSIYQGADPLVSPKIYEEWHRLIGMNVND